MDHSLNNKNYPTLNLQQFENVDPTMGSQQLEGLRNLRYSHLLTYLSIDIASRSQQHKCKKLRSPHGMKIVETTL
jgi:hypothetical protein